MRPGSYVIDHTTNKPEIARRLHTQGSIHGVKVLDIPVSGGEIGAIKGRLVGMVGGDTDDLEAVRPLL